MELPTSNIKKCLIFSQSKAFLIFQETKTPEKLLIFSQKKAVLTFRKTETLKNSLYFRKRNFLIFQERYIQNPGIMKLFYISGKVYSELWHNGTFLYFEKGIFRNLTYLKQEVHSEP